MFFPISVVIHSMASGGAAFLVPQQVAVALTGPDGAERVEVLLKPCPLWSSASSAPANPRLVKKRGVGWVW